LTQLAPDDIDLNLPESRPAPSLANFGDGLCQGQDGTIGLDPLVRGAALDLTLFLLEMCPARWTRAFVFRQVPEI
jgi:hypothetical protein